MFLAHIFGFQFRCTILIVYRYTAGQREKAVSSSFTSKQILFSAFAEQHTSGAEPEFKKGDPIKKIKKYVSINNFVSLLSLRWIDTLTLLW